ncbi:hypothetical protein [Rhizobium sp. BK176]|uniref:hypothetical protein n=1 Tax=Rhizobium sp. BK176 TaxID=2587071 RepID=UPI00216844CD|nr:hypothetical protein [Rhizobium sp. BK176]MCS4089937.1 hypothetical protein [Rhizobium sp. BK176]
MRPISKVSSQEVTSVLRGLAANPAPFVPDESFACLTVDEGNVADYAVEKVFAVVDQMTLMRLQTRAGMEPLSGFGMTLHPALFTSRDAAEEVLETMYAKGGPYTIMEADFEGIPAKSLGLKLNDDGSLRYFAVVARIKGSLFSESPATTVAPTAPPRP